VTDHAPTGRGATGGLAIGVLAGTVLAYLFQLVGGRLLGPEDFAPVSVLWTVMFLTGTIGLTPVEQLVAREATAGRRVLTRRSGAVLGVVGGTALTAAVFVAATRTALFQGETGFILLAVILVSVTAPLFMSRGLAIGQRRFDLYATMITLEGVGRLGFGGLGYVLVGGPVGFAWGIALGPLLGLLVPAWRFERRALLPRRGGERAFLLPYLGAGAASQLLVAGAPLAVAALGADASTISIVFVTFTLFRAPVTVVYLVQGRLLNALVRHRLRGEIDRLRTVRRRIEFGGAAAVATAGAVAWSAGPAVVVLLYGEAFRPDPVVAALAATGVAGAAVAQLLGQLLVADGRTASLAQRWTVGLSAAAVMLVASTGDAALAVAAAFAVGGVMAAAAMAVRPRREHA
jgi:O-antigen/teichoic acid export membrane protein